jgi:ribosomal protein S13
MFIHWNIIEKNLGHKNLLDIYDLNINKLKIFYNRFGINNLAKLKKISTKFFSNFCKYIEFNIDVKEQLLKKKYDIIENFKKLKIRKGWYHIYNLPVNNQRTKSNAKTKKLFLRARKKKKLKK